MFKTSKITAAILTLVLGSSYAYSDLPNKINIVNKGDIPVVDVRGIDPYKFKILGAGTDEIYATDLKHVGIYNLTGALTKTIKSNEYGEIPFRDIKALKKVGDRYYALLNGCLIESKGDLWKKHCSQQHNKYILDYGYDKDGNIYSLHRWGKPDISIKKPGTNKFKHFAQIPQLTGNAVFDIDYYTTDDGTSVIKASIDDNYTVLTSKDQKTYTPIEQFKDYRLLGITPNGELLVYQDGRYLKTLSTMTLDGITTNLNLAASQIIHMPNYTTINDVMISSANGLLCFNVGFQREQYCKTPNGKLQLIHDDETLVSTFNGVVTLVDK